MKSWLKNAVFYEIYPQSFRDANGDGIGDFAGIIEKLDYIKNTGFTAIWMNPCFASPFMDAGYDVEDYYKAAPRYGSNDDLKRLFQEVHKRGMHILLDLVAGHTSYKCQWFQESMKPEKNPYSHRYIWTDDVWEDCGNIPGIKGMLRGISQRNGSCLVNYFSTQPALNYGFAKITRPWQCAVDSQAALSTRRELIRIMDFWLEMGCDGFRVDMAPSLIKNDENQKETVKLWQAIFREVRERHPDAVFVSEWGEPEKALIAGFDMDFLLHLGPSHYLDLFRVENPYFSPDGKGDLQEFFALYLKNLQLTQGRGLICIPSGNHDMPRLAHRLDETQIRLAYAFLMSMPGVPFIYYGDEIGMRYLESIPSVEGGYHRTGARSPMQWDDTKNCGFSSAAADQLYVPMDPSADRPTVSAQQRDPNSLYHALKNLIRIRSSHPALQESGTFTPVQVKGYPLVYKRTDGEQDILVAINPSAKEEICDFDGCLGEILYSFNGEAKQDSGKLRVPGCSASYIQLA